MKKQNNNIVVCNVYIVVMFAMGDYICLLSFISLRHNFVDIVVLF